MNNDNNICKNKGLYIFLTIFLGLVFCVLKIFSFGWMTLIFFALIILYLALFNISNIFNALLKNKNKKDHLRFWGINFFFLLSGLTFCDYSDTESIKILNFLSDNVSGYICQFSVLIVIILCIISISTYSKRKKSNQIK